MTAIKITDDNFEEEVVKSTQPFLVDFWAEWCAPCRAVSPLIEELAGEYEGKLKVGKMNVDDNQKIPATFGIMSIPTLMIFKEGMPQKTIIGAQGKDAYKKAIEETLS